MVLTLQTEDIENPPGLIIPNDNTWYHSVKYYLVTETINNTRYDYNVINEAPETILKIDTDEFVFDTVYIVNDDSNYSAMYLKDEYSIMYHVKVFVITALVGSVMYAKLKLDVYYSKKQTKV